MMRLGSFSTHSRKGGGSSHSRKSGKKKDSLPVGVAKVPKWWMDLTPHYTLDLEEDEMRKRTEAQLDQYYMYMALASDAGLIGADGNPVLGPDGKPLSSSSWNNGWAGRSASGAGPGSGPGGPGGRQFKSGSYKIDPKQFGIDESDPDYHAYLTGAKLPPGFLEKLAEMQRQFNEQGLLANNLHQTEHGKYGAEKPQFQPAWAKMKLRSTNAGASIRQGQYNDSPNKFLQRRVKDSTGSIYDAGNDDALKKLPAPPTYTAEENAEPAVAPEPAAKVTPEPKKTPSARGLFGRRKQQSEDESNPPVPTSVEITNNQECGKQKRLVRKVRRIPKKKDAAPGKETQPIAPSAPAPTPSPEHAPAPPEQAPSSAVKPALRTNPRWTAPSPSPASPKSAAATAPRAGSWRKPSSQAPPASATSAPHHHTPSTASSRAIAAPEPSPAIVHKSPHSEPESNTYSTHAESVVEEEVLDEEYDEEIIEEDVYEEEYGSEYEEEVVEEEVLEEEDDIDDDFDGGDDNLADLQATLAAKMAELQRLQAQM